jgi:hypothetical protein
MPSLRSSTTSVLAIWTVAIRSATPCTTRTERRGPGISAVRQRRGWEDASGFDATSYVGEPAVSRGPVLAANPRRVTRDDARPLAASQIGRLWQTTDEDPALTEFASSTTSWEEARRCSAER